MDNLTHYRTTIEKLLSDYAVFLGEDEQIKTEIILDPIKDHYLLVETGWQNNQRIYGTLIHIDIIDGKIWIQQDGTEDGIAEELVALGIPKTKIVLGFKSVHRRQITEYAIC